MPLTMWSDVASSYSCSLPETEGKSYSVQGHGAGSRAWAVFGPRAGLCQLLKRELAELVPDFLFNLSWNFACQRLAQRQQLSTCSAQGLRRSVQGGSAFETVLEGFPRSSRRRPRWLRLSCSAA